MSWLSDEVWAKATDESLPPGVMCIDVGMGPVWFMWVADDDPDSPAERPGQ